LAALAFVALMFVPTLSRSEDRRKILVMLEETKPAFLTRLRAELASYGFGVAVSTPSTFPPDRPEIEQLAQQEGALVGLLMLEAGATVEIWGIDPLTGKAAFREVLFGLYQPQEAPEVIALRVAETLRAILMDVEHLRARAPESSWRPAPEIVLPTGSRPARFTLGIGGGGVYSAGGLGAMGHFDLSLRWAASSRFSFALDGALTPMWTKLREPEGDTNVALYLSGASFGFTPSHPTAPVQFRAGAGVWLAVMSLSGRATARYSDSRADLVSVVPHLDVATLFSLTSRLRLGLGLSGGVSTSRASIRYAGREVATWGRPLWLASLLFESSLD
jgi:hypothetical protein